MDNLERLFNDEKNKLDHLEVPQELKATLSEALENTTNRKSNRVYRRAAILIIFFLFLGYNLDTLAYYGSKLVGYEHVMTGAIQELNEMGKGQLIEETHTFSDGVSVLVEGVMLDDNGITIFYTTKDPNGNIEDLTSRMSVTVEGVFGRGFSSGGSGEIDEDENQVKWMLQTREAPKFYENKLKLNISYTTNDGKSEFGQISFRLDRSKAVGKSLHFSINKRIKVEDSEIHLKSLMASPTTTVVKGQLQSLLALGFDHITNQRIYPEKIELALYANGKELSQQGSGMSTNLKGINFESIFDRLPTDTEVLELKLLSFDRLSEVNKEIGLVKGENKLIRIANQQITIDRVYEDNHKTYITISSEESVTLLGVNLFIDNQKKQLDWVIPVNTDKKLINGDAKMIYTRTLEFNGVGEKLKLEINRIKLNQKMNKTIYTQNIK